MLYIFGLNGDGTEEEKRIITCDNGFFNKYNCQLPRFSLLENESLVEEPWRICCCWSLSCHYLAGPTSPQRPPLLNDVIGSIQTIMNSLSDPPFPHYMWRFIKKNLQILQEGFLRTFHIFNVSFHEPQRGIALNYLSTNCRAASAS